MRVANETANGMEFGHTSRKTGRQQVNTMEKLLGTAYKVLSLTRAAARIGCSAGDTFSVL